MRALVTAALSAAALFCLPFSVANAQEDERNKDPAVNYREQVMKGIAANAAAIGLIVEKKVPQDENLALHADGIALGAREALRAFEPRSLGGTAKPEIWDNWKDFSDRLRTLDASASEVARLARAGGVTAAAPKVLDMLSCKSCHDKYRTK